jgi:hypothetical protein
LPASATLLEQVELPDVTDAATPLDFASSFTLAPKGGSGELPLSPLSVRGSFFKFAILLVRLLGTTCFMSRASLNMRS